MAEERVVYQAPPSNGMGIAGFVCSLVGLLGCPLLSPIGLIFSFIGIFREPRGLAIAGLVLGAVGSMGFLVAIVIFGGLIALVVAVLAALGFERFDAIVEMGIINAEISEYRQSAGAWPDSLDQLSGLDADTLQDPWGRAYRYVLSDDGKTYMLVSDGPDRQPDTGDDIRVDLSGVQIR